MFQIGPVTVKGRLVLASMEEHTDLPFRRLAKEFGANLVATEMVQSDRLVKGDKMALRMLATEPSERPVLGQVLAGEVADTVAAARIVEEKGFDAVDVNLSCPIRRVIERGWGASYLKSPERIHDLLSRIVAGVGIPVTVKIRSGWDDTTIHAPEVAQLAEQVGIKAVTLHARTAVQAYRGPADWSLIRRTREAVGIPIMGSGSVRTPEDVARMLDETGCAGVSIARGALGNPWIFSRARALLAGRPLPPPPGREERLRVLLRHLEAEARFLGKRQITPRLLRLAFYYAKDLPDFEGIQSSAREARNLGELFRILKKTFRGA
ncbi:MAG: tRNA-dihydrouridine synthase family protein [Planctomycetota bacterium]